MALKKPQSMDECVYFTLRSLGEKGEVTAWVFRNMCPKCKKALMGKPRDDNTGKVKTRASEYVCPSCGHRVEKQEYEDTLTVNIEYTCPKCMNSSETQVPFKRKKVEGTDAVIFFCGKCKEKLLVTKKLKEIKKKKKGEEEIEDDDA